MSDAKRYWIPGPLTNYGTTANGFAGEVLVVAAVDYGELERDLRDATIEADRVHKEHAEMIDSYEAKLEEYERRIEELTEALELNPKDKHWIEGYRQGATDGAGEKP